MGPCFAVLVHRMQKQGGVCARKNPAPGIDSRAGAWYPVDNTCNTGCCAAVRRRCFWLQRHLCSYIMNTIQQGPIMRPSQDRRMRTMISTVYQLVNNMEANCTGKVAIQYYD